MYVHSFRQAAFHRCLLGLQWSDWWRCDEDQQLSLTQRYKIPQGSSSQETCGIMRYLTFRSTLDPRKWYCPWKIHTIMLTFSQSHAHTSLTRHQGHTVSETQDLALPQQVNEFLSHGISHSKAPVHGGNCTTYFAGQALNSAFSKEVETGSHLALAAFQNRVSWLLEHSHCHGALFGSGPAGFAR